MNPGMAVLLVLLTLGFWIGVLRGIQRRFSLHPELVRKLLHIGMGLVTLSFPWLFDQPGPVWVLAGAALSMLGLLRFWKPVKRAAGSVLYSVNRRSVGEVYFVCAVALIFDWSGGDPLRYCIPVLILTLADAAGALAGVRYGVSRFQTDEGEKSVEGSVVVFTVAFLSAHVPLLLFSQSGRAEVLLISLTLGILVMLIEAVSWRGLDNLLIPVGAFLVLDIYRQLTVQELLVRLIVIVTLTLFAWLWRGRTTISDSGALAGGIFGYLVWALAGWSWVIAPLLLFIIYAQLPPLISSRIPGGNVQAVVRVMAGPCAWLLLSLQTGAQWLMALYYATFAAHLAQILLSRDENRTQTSIGSSGFLGIILISGMVMALPLAVYGGTRIEIALLFVTVFISTWVFRRMASYCNSVLAPYPVVWMREAVLAPVIAGILFLPVAYCSFNQ